MALLCDARARVRPTVRESARARVRLRARHRTVWSYYGLRSQSHQYWPAVEIDRSSAWAIRGPRSQHGCHGAGATAAAFDRGIDPAYRHRRRCAAGSKMLTKGGGCRP